MANNEYNPKKEKNKGLIKAAIVLGIVAVAMLIVSFIVPLWFSEYKGEVQGTEYIYQEYSGINLSYYCVSPSGDIYVPVNSSVAKAINIYDENGDYKYSLSSLPLYADAPKFDENGNLLLDYPKGEQVYAYDDKGNHIRTIDYEEYEFSYNFFEPQAEQTVNGKTYIQNGDTLYKINGNNEKEAIITKPLWDKIISMMFPLGFFICLFVAAICGGLSISNSKKEKKNLG